MTFSALSSSRLPTMTDCSFSSADGSAFRARRCRHRLRPGRDRLLARRSRRLAGLGQRRLGDLLARGGAMPGGGERFRRLGYGSTPSLARIALAEAVCCGTLRNTHAGGSIVRQHRRHPLRTPRMRRVGAPHARTKPDDCSWDGARQRREYGGRFPANGASAATAPGCRHPSARRTERAGIAHAAGGAACRRVARAEHRLDRGRDDMAIVGERARRRQALGERRHAALRLQRIAGRHQQPDLVEPQAGAAPVR